MILYGKIGKFAYVVHHGTLVMNQIKWTVTNNTNTDNNEERKIIFFIIKNIENDNVYWNQSSSEFHRNFYSKWTIQNCDQSNIAKPRYLLPVRIGP